METAVFTMVIESTSRNEGYHNSISAKEGAIRADVVTICEERLIPVNRIGLERIQVN